MFNIVDHFGKGPDPVLGDDLPLIFREAIAMLALNFFSGGVLVAWGMFIGMLWWFGLSLFSCLFVAGRALSGLSCRSGVLPGHLGTSSVGSLAAGGGPPPCARRGEWEPEDREPGPSETPGGFVCIVEWVVVCRHTLPASYSISDGPGVAYPAIAVAVVCVRSHTRNPTSCAQAF